MPIRYELNDVHRRVIVGILYNLRGMLEEPTVADLHELMSEGRSLTFPKAARTPAVDVTNLT
jgi:hypothetical protein